VLNYISVKLQGEVVYMYKQSETKEKYFGFPMKMNAYAHEGLFIMQKDEDAFLLYFILGKRTIGRGAALKQRLSH
jgi:hypothetical protein